MTLDPNLKVQVDWNNNVIELRQSAISTFLDCRRQFYWEYMRGIEPDYPEGLRPWTNADIGTCFHEAMEERSGEGIATFAERNNLGLNSKGKPFDSELVRIMYEGHLQDLAETGKDIGETRLFTEESFVAEVHDVRHWLVRIHARVDRVVETSDGIVILDDLKSVDRIVEIDNYLPQVVRYAMIVRAATGLRVDRVRTTQVRRSKRTGDGPFFDRPWCPVNETMYADAAINLRGVLEDLTRCIETDGPWYEHRTTECSWRCRVEDLCKAQVRGDDPETIVNIHYREKA